MRFCILALFCFLALTAGLPHAAAMADDQGNSANTARARGNRPPKPDLSPRIEPSTSDITGGGETPLRSGRTTRVTFRAEDPDDDRLVYSIDPIPAGATFDQDAGVLTWKPSRNQEGKHEVTFSVTDGELTAKRRILLVVRPNRAPKDTGETVIFRGAKRTVLPGDASEGGQDGMALLANDEDSDDVTVKVRRQPAGAHVNTRGSAVYFAWQPSEADVGEHDLVVEVSDGELRTTVSRKVVVIPEWAAHDYHRWLLLGGGPSGFVTHGDGEVFVGGTFDATLVAIREDELTGYACAHGMRDRECHASHHRFYGQFEALDSTRSGAPALFTYGVGYSASLEWYPARRYLIPHYGIDIGGLVRSEVGHRAEVHPYFGLHLWTNDDVWVDATAGYRVVPAELRDLTGPTFALRAIVNPW